MKRPGILLCILVGMAAGCASDPFGTDFSGIEAADVDGIDDATADSHAGHDHVSDMQTDQTSGDIPATIPPIRLMTFNTGTSEANGKADPDDRYTEWHASQSDEYYGDGLAWMPAIEAAKDFIDAKAPDIIAFQEIFHSAECADIPLESRTDFICTDWRPGDPTVASIITGDDYQVMCNPGKPDKCSAVRKSFGRFRGCDDDFCLEGMTGCTVDTCGKGARIGRATIELNGGGEINLVSVHASSGFKEDEMQCRAWQFEQIFVDMCGAGPGATGDVSVVMGDFNTDPGRAVIFDPSAARLLDFVGVDKEFHFLTEVGEDVAPTYGGVGNIDHVVSNILEGSCWAAGVTEGHPPVIVDTVFDHVPIVCDVAMPSL
ncbi:MAG TPA: hypothetical protein PLC24_05050 [Myxococcota bacterium]|nr:hypothetical protein [Myxococcota bacterium]HPV03916.1 hypothetical protein [Myxococcota bacterium]